ncbi:hydrogenase (NiFe) small subunit HydA [Desulfovibrio sp. X2]|uniref:hydrogenase small subunit n=1 Tax=Desulfovibrio sp. X2 TaxID=941449 RepID=UPI000358E276|nr:hydrogenase small subunit [Desulfovibrio sp. X2]EPR41664.1 hydrogenase (NiFe) small subunit HydA [Desulfovibrio sp. X2]
MSASARIEAKLLERQVGGERMSRRDFIKFCCIVATAIGMEASHGATVARALESKTRPSVIYMHGAECTGCTEALLRSVDPYFDVLIMETISLDYCETIMAAAGKAANEALEKAMQNPAGYFCTIEGAIPMRGGGVWGQVGGETMLSLFARVAGGAKGVIAMGTCASFGGIQAAEPNPSMAVGVGEALAAMGVSPINISGCPPNPMNYVGTVAHLLTKGMPELDELGRPKMFYGSTVHDQCERRKHFDAGEFAPSFDSREAREGWCLHLLGCRGPYTYNNCPTALFNQTNWPVRAGAPCLGCSEPDFWDTMAPFNRDVRMKGEKA